jgi:DNA polymerase
VTSIITIDFETYYSPQFSLTKISTEEYVRHKDFQVIGFAYKIDDGPPNWVTGSDDFIAQHLRSLPWKTSFVLAHNTMFDGAILAWRYDVTPKGWLDTLSMGRALHGVEAGGSLKAMAERYGVGEKGTEVHNFINYRRESFTAEQLYAYGRYCTNDVQLTRYIFNKMMALNFPLSELKLIDLTLRMFTHPVLELDSRLLEKHLEEVSAAKQAHLVGALQAIGHKDLAVKQIIGNEEMKAEVRSVLMSNPKFAEMLKTLGVEPPKKISMTTGKQTFAFAKSDEAFKKLLEHEDIRVQALAAARIGTKSTLEETRTQRFIGLASRGKFPVPLKYYAAHTGRWGGSDSINLQNLPSRGANAGKLKKAIVAPEGYVFIDADSSQIEARTLAWEAGQDDLVRAFAKGEDVYKIMASAIYHKPTDEITIPERFVGKTTILGAGYGMGGPKFKAQLKTFGTDVTEEEAKRIITTYRAAYPMIPELWQKSHEALRCMVRGQTMKLCRNGLLTIEPNGIKLPNGLYIHYKGLREMADEQGKRQFVYDTRAGQTKIYGGKVVENFTQAVARCIIGDQILKIAKRYKVVLTVHDAIGIVAREAEAEEARAYVESCMRWVPSWAEGLPVNCESGMGKSYGDC